MSVLLVAYLVSLAHVARFFASQKDVLLTVFGFLEYFLTFLLLFLRMKSNRCLLKTMAIFLNLLLKQL